MLWTILGLILTVLAARWVLKALNEIDGPDNAPNPWRGQDILSDEPDREDWRTWDSEAEQRDD